MRLSSYSAADRFLGRRVRVTDSTGDGRSIHRRLEWAGNPTGWEPVGVLCSRHAMLVVIWDTRCPVESVNDFAYLGPLGMSIEKRDTGCLEVLE